MTDRSGKKNGKGAGAGNNRHRAYRDRIAGVDLHRFTVRVKETDLHIQAETELAAFARESVLLNRRHVEAHISRFPDFADALAPWSAPEPVPRIIAGMVQAGMDAGVGPMAAVAGAMAEAVGIDLLTRSAQVIVENGGDLFLKTDVPAVVGIYAGDSPLSMRFGIRIDTSRSPAAICTSSGTFGHSLSMGNADAVCVCSQRAPLADAAATAIANRIRSAGDIQAAVDFGKTIPDVTGILAVIGDKMGVWGELELVPL